MMLMAKIRLRRVVASILFSMQLPMAAIAQGIPETEGTCVDTRIAALEHRLRPRDGVLFDKHSGSAVRYTNGAYQVSYQESPQVGRSRVGDPVTLCLIRIPHDCPAGDVRGRTYTATNLRILESWTMMDAEHSCGGA